MLRSSTRQPAKLSTAFVASRRPRVLISGMAYKAPKRRATRPAVDPLRDRVNKLRHAVDEIDLSDSDDVTLRLLATAQRASAGAIDQAILRLRTHGRSYADIAAGLGISAQAVHQRFTHLQQRASINLG